MSNPAIPPKKRSFFKKAAWQTAEKAEGEEKKGLFSHSSEFKDIVAEQQARQKKEREAQEEQDRANREAQDIKQKTDHERKRRKIIDDLDSATRLSRSGSSAPESTRASKDRQSRSPNFSPETKPRVDSLTKSNAAGTLQRTSDVIEVSDASNSDDDLYAPPKNLNIPSRPSGSQPQFVPIEDDVEEVEDPVFAELAAKARARRRAEESKAATNSSQTIVNGTSKPQDTAKDGIVNLLIESALPETRLLLVKIRLSSSLEKPRVAWCQKQGFSREQTEEIFLTWKMRQLYDYTTIARLGVKVDDNGFLSVEGDDNIYTEDEPPKIHLQAWTQDLYEQYKRQEAEEEAKQRRLPYGLPQEKQEDVIVEKVVEKKIRLFLKAKGLEELRISAKPDTTIETLTNAYRTARKIAADTTITFLFDGDRLKPMDTVGDTEIEDMDALDVVLN